MPRTSLQSLLLIPTINTLIFSSLIPIPSTLAYIPALPVNDTSALNLTDSSTISISWTDPPSVYSGPVSYQLQADIPTGGQSSGALVHFTESTMGPNITTSTPWIAYISCDVNETSASNEWDIFTLARDRGAVSALLYTAKSQSCLLNQEYIQDFEKPLDVFATKTVQVARVIDNQWIHTNDTFYTYNGTLLNDSAIDVNNSLTGDAPTYRTYLIGTLTARNSTGQATPTSIPNASASPTGNSGHHTPGSMIALYVVTGLISAMFILMVFVGARRALRHPERYGRREAGDEQGAQSTAGGVAQAILDTFPVIKFRRDRPQQSEESEETSFTPKRMSSDANLSIALPSLSGHHPPQYRRESLTMGMGDANSLHSVMESGPSRSIEEDGGNRRQSSVINQNHTHGRPQSSTSPSASRRTSGHDLNRMLATEDERVDDQCPICLLDFEEGDDLRVLPCEIGHVYHQACIDPWLLQVSSSCPLCRKDFNNPNPAPTPQSTHPRSESPTPIPSPTSSSHPATSASGTPHPPTQSGFARYLAFMRRERPGNNPRGGRRRAGTGGTIASDVGPGRRREADQTGPGGY